MPRIAVVLVLVLAASTSLTGSPATAQTGPLPVTPGAGAYLPAAEAIGDGWREIGRRGIAPGPELFREGAKAVYGGPAGARAILFAWVILDDENQTAVRRSWESTGELMESYRAVFAANASPATARLGALPPPPGCAEAARAEGTDAAAEFPGGLTRCAVDPDVILLAVVSGDLAGRSGARAADALIAAALAAAGEDLATPKP